VAKGHGHGDIQSEFPRLYQTEGYRFVYQDHIGSTRQLSRSDMQRDYYPFGQTLTAAGDDLTSMQFSQKQVAPDSNIYYFGVRYYSPRIGRWLVPDPAGQGFSPYVYCGNNSLNMVDPNGALFGIDDLFFWGMVTYSGYQGGKSVNSGENNPLHWDWTSIKTYVGVGAGAGSSYAGAWAGDKISSALASQAFSSLAYSLSMNALTGGKYPIHMNAGPFSYNFSTGKGNIANAFTDSGAFCSYTSWRPFFYDLRNIPGGKYAMFAYDIPNNAAGSIINTLQGNKFSHMDWDNMILYWEGRGNESFGHNIALDPDRMFFLNHGIMPKNTIPKDFFQTFLHEQYHVSQYTLYGPLMSPMYWLNEGLGYLWRKTPFYPSQFYFPFTPAHNIFEYSAWKWATQNKGW
jgi:RHS repeat-associated protein